LSLWPTFDGFLNGPKPPEDCPECSGAWTRLRAELDSLLTVPLRNEIAARHGAVDLPLILELVRGGWVAHVSHGPAERSNGCTSMAPDFAPLLLLLLSHHDVRPLVKACAACRRFFVRPRASLQGDRRAFCSSRCRQAWARTPPGRAANRRRQSEHRRTYPGRARR
jgi:hypothetical protein